MSAILAIVFGFVAVGYAMWPVWRRRDLGTLPHELSEARTPELIANGAAAARRWSAAAGELRDGRLDPERFPK